MIAPITNNINDDIDDYNCDDNDKIKVDDDDNDS